MGGQSVREALRADTNLWYGVVCRPVGAVNGTPVSRGLTVPDGTRQMVCRASGPAPRDIQPCACRHLLRLVARKRVGLQ